MRAHPDPQGVYLLPATSRLIISIICPRAHTHWIRDNLSALLHECYWLRPVSCDVLSAICLTTRLLGLVCISWEWSSTNLVTPLISSCPESPTCSSGGVPFVDTRWKIFHRVLRSFTCPKCPAPSRILSTYRHLMLIEQLKVSLKWQYICQMLQSNITLKQLRQFRPIIRYSASDQSNNNTIKIIIIVLIPF